MKHLFTIIYIAIGTLSLAADKPNIVFILADDMGLGKTIQIIALLLLRQEVRRHTVREHRVWLRQCATRALSSRLVAAMRWSNRGSPGRALVDTVAASVPLSSSIRQCTGPGWSPAFVVDTCGEV